VSPISRFATVPIGISPNHNRAERPHQISDREGPERQEERDKVVAAREEQLGQGDGERAC
jgi:hypothetical protein